MNRDTHIHTKRTKVSKNYTNLFLPRPPPIPPVLSRRSTLHLDFHQARIRLVNEMSPTYGDPV